MIRRSKPLQRKTVLSSRTSLSSRSALTRGGKLRARSAKRAKWQREERAPFVAALLEEFPWCQMQVEGVCTGRAVEVDELLNRSAGGSATSRDNCQTVCRACHDWKGHNRLAAEALGFVRRGYGGAA